MKFQHIFKFYYIIQKTIQGNNLITVYKHHRSTVICSEYIQSLALICQNVRNKMPYKQQLSIWCTLDRFKSNKDFIIYFKHSFPTIESIIIMFLTIIIIIIYSLSLILNSTRH